MIFSNKSHYFYFIDLIVDPIRPIQTHSMNTTEISSGLSPVEQNESTVFFVKTTTLCCSIFGMFALKSMAYG